jgi:hypothetical protein
MEFRGMAMGGCLTRRNIQWPNHLAQDIPSFATWLLNIVRVHIANGVDVDPTVISFSHLSRLVAYMYKSMWAYDNHYPVDDHEECMAHVTYESGVACIFRQGNCCFVLNRTIIMPNVHYVNVLK